MELVGRWSRWAALLLGLFILSVPRSSWAGPTRVLFVRGVGAVTPAIEDAVVVALRAHFGGGPIALDVVSLPAAEGLRAQADAVGERVRTSNGSGGFWLRDGDDEIQLYFVEREPERILVRRIPRAAPTTLAETVALMTHFTAEALATGATIGMEPVVVPAPAPIPRVKLPEPTPVAAPRPVPVRIAWERGDVPRSAPRLVHRLGPAVSYVGTTRSAAFPWRHGVRVALSWAPVPAWRIETGLLVFPAQAAEIDGNRLSLEQVGGELGVARRWSVGPLLLGARLRGGVARLERLTLRSATEVTPSVRDRRAVAYAAALATLGIQPWPWLELDLGLGPELGSRVDLAVQTPSGLRVLDAPHPVRLRLELGAVASF